MNADCSAECVKSESLEFGMTYVLYSVLPLLLQHMDTKLGLSYPDLCTKAHACRLNALDIWWAMICFLVKNLAKKIDM